AQAFSPENAKEKISMVVEGAYTAASASKRGHELGIPLPITDAVYHIIYEGLSPQTAVRELMTRAVKQEML
ncbi:MAG: glycerol-3-phosphate dehydrogenase, partial [Chlamydiia bacterium]|nr:glycerol-3-phosphate dehydrogenase [Chlamydiia bacterium]